MGSNHSSPVEYNPIEGLDDLTDVARTVLMVIQVISCIIGGAGNSLTILAVLCNKKLQTYNNFYVTHLALVDLTISLVLVPINIHGLWRGAPPHCDIVAAVALSTIVLSILSLFMIAFNRYILICRTFRDYQRIYTRRNVLISLIVMWLYSLAVVLPMFSFKGFGWSVKTHYCFFTNYNFLSYIYVVTVIAPIGNMLPTFGTATCYMFIIKKIRSSERMMKRMRPEIRVRQASGSDDLHVHSSPQQVQFFSCAKKKLFIIKSFCRMKLKSLLDHHALIKTLS